MMISRTIIVTGMALALSGAALAQVEVNTPNVQVKTPAAGVDLDVNVGSKLTPTDAWIGRAVYSADGKHLGEVAAVADDQTYVDIGGFLGIGESRVLLANDKIDGVTDDRMILKLTEAEVKNLPAVDDKQ
jgi:hypothetical protein